MEGENPNKEAELKTSFKLKKIKTSFKLKNK